MGKEKLTEASASQQHNNAYSVSEPSTASFVSSCILCGAARNILTFKNKGICDNCLCDVKNTFGQKNNL